MDIKKIFAIFLLVVVAYSIICQILKFFAYIGKKPKQTLKYILYLQNLRAASYIYSAFAWEKQA
jgi:hypothetical protein